MRRLLMICVCSGLFAAPAMAADPYETYLTQQQERGVEIEMIRVANEKPLVESEVADEEVANILEEAEALEEDVSYHEDAEDSSSEE